LPFSLSIWWFGQSWFGQVGIAMVSKAFQKRLSSSWMALLLFIVGYWPQKLHRSMGVPRPEPTTLYVSPPRSAAPRPLGCLAVLAGMPILALRILAEIDLNRADLYRDTFIELVWCFGQRNPPTRFYPIGRQMLRSFQHVKRSACHHNPAFKSYDK
jgi:hypothetical protein